MPQLGQARVSDSQSTDTAGPTVDASERAADGGRGNAAAVDGLNLGATGTPRGGTQYTVVRGDTLWDIAKRTYGSGTYWRQIAQANPTQVFRDGELILVGAVLRLPTLTVPGDAGDAGGTSAGPEADGGTSQATPPEGVCTEYGDFNIYPDEFVGALPPSVDGVRNVRRSEYDAIIAAAEAEAAAERGQVETEVEDLLSYGVLDWAITDGEATRALSLLGGLPLSQLRVAVGNIPNIGRLIEQLPANARSGPAFTRLLVALGPDRIGPYLQDLLSYGLFDWCVTDGDARAVIEVLALLSGSQRLAVLERLGKPLQARLLENLPGRGSALSAGDKAVVKAIFDAAADSDLDLLTLAFEVRFNLDVRGSEGEAWDAAGLRRCWEVLETMPAGHVEGNPALLQWIRYGSSAASHGGWYADDRFGEDSYGAGFNYTSANIGTANQRSRSDEDGDGVNDTTDPLHGVNRFNKVVRHEVGHAVDEAMGAVPQYCIGKPAGGNWTDYASNKTTAISDMVASSNAGVQAVDATTRTALITAMGASPANALAAAQGTAEYQALDAAGQAGVDADPVFGALTQAIDDPWYNHSAGGTALGGRVFQQSYSSQWTAYDVTARARKVSEYQFRAPGEWFAEAYAAYYQPNTDGTCDHHFLGNIDPTTKTWFDNNVDTWAGNR